LPEANRGDALVDLNVLEQSLNVCETTVVQDAWERGQSVVVHGWVYGLHNGLLEDLKITVANAGEVAAAYGLALGALLAVPVGRLEALLGLGAGLAEQLVVAVEAVEQRLGDVEGARVVQCGDEAARHQATPRAS